MTLIELKEYEKTDVQFLFVANSNFQLLQLTIGDNEETWSSAGFDVMELPNSKPVCQVGSVQLLFDSTGQQGISRAAVHGVSGVIDSLKFDTAPSLAFSNIDAWLPSVHPNGVTRIDHLVVTTADCDRTTRAFESNGIHPRRVRTFGNDEDKMRQTFFWLGDVILELVGPDQSETNGNALFWGLALISDNLQATADYLGEKCTPVKSAVQPGRKITTIKTREIGITTSLAVMSAHLKTS
ncbi:MAG: hypothetical protein CL438_05385 [Acidimicrobiaceae bacterium]|nr:hypothetical protein [Acidimicrobiaceae bacterium]